MRIVLQRVTGASVSIDGTITAQIAQGLLLLLGIEEADTEEDTAWLSSKIIGMRIFNDAAGVMNLSVKDLQGNILLVSQFTLHASIKKGNRPSYLRAARPEKALPLYKRMIMQLEADLGKPLHTGTFGADMQVSLVNDGPVTILLDSRNREERF